MVTINSMKKILMLCSFLFMFIQGSAQQFQNKRGQNVLPEAGNWAVGFDVIPILKYAGNLFYNGSDSTRDFSTAYPLTVTGKYVIKNNLSYRAAFRLDLYGLTTDTLVAKTGSTNINEKVSNQRKEKSTTFYVSSGIEKRKGITQRVTGIYGVDVAVLINSSKTSYTYGNELELNNQQDSQVKKVKDGTLVGFGFRGFLGVEYFIAAKMSLSAEYGFGPSISNRGRGSIETQVVDGNSTKTVIEETEKAFGYGFKSDINGGIVALTFYF